MAEMVAQKLAAKPESASSQTEPAAVAFMGELDHPLNTEVRSQRRAVSTRGLGSIVIPRLSRHSRPVTGERVVRNPLLPRPAVGDNAAMSQPFQFSMRRMFAVFAAVAFFCASSAEFMGEFRLGEGAEGVI